MPLSTVELRRLMRDYKIRFKGPAHPKTWPQEYRDIFCKISEIRRQDFDSCQPDNPDDILSVNDTKARVREVVHAAGRDYFWGPVNESTLRHRVERLVFSRFTAEIRCKSCRRLFWKSEFTAIPGKRAGVADSRNRRDGAQLCQCDFASRTWENFEDNSETFLFRDLCEEIVEPDPDDAQDLKDRGLQQQKPDVIFGLNFTKSFQRYTEVWTGIRHSPLHDKNLLYPFLVVEAKSGRNGEGFENIEAQTAFPLRTCLKLQDDLRRASGQPLRPLVWFMAYRGDEWRLAACVVDERYPDEAHVYDLWMGRALSWDGALQLLHIVDFICDWARTVYRHEILACLANGRNFMHRLTPAATSQTSGQDSVFLRTASFEEKSYDDDMTGNSRESDFDMIKIDQEERPDAASPLNVVDINSSDPIMPTHPWLRWETKDTYWTQNATVRHSDMVRFRFTQLNLPEDRASQLKCLGNMKDMQGDTIESVAHGLLTSYMDREAAVTTTLEYIDRVKTEWLKVSDDTPVEIGVHTRAWFSFTTEVQKDNWQIERRLFCMTCTLQAARGLALIAGMNNTMLEAFYANSVTEYNLPPSTFGSLRTLTGNISLVAAMNAKSLYLSTYRDSDRRYKCLWATRSELSSLEVRTLLLLFENAITHGGLLLKSDRKSKVQEVFRVPLPKSVAHLLPAAIPAPHGAILLRKGPDWPASTPTWCLMISKEVDFEDQREIGLALERVRMRQDVYSFVVGGFRHEIDLERGEATQQLGEHFLDAWTETPKT